jgi:glycosyltransferase involved in cell wall biosynthesis
MRVALTHDYLNQFGGAERVLEVFSEMYPEAPIYTLFYDEKALGGRFRDKIAKTSFLDKDFIKRHHRAFIPLMPFAARSINLSKDYDVVISNSVGFGKAMRYKNARHIFYCNALLRYAWNPETHLKDFLPRYLYPLAYLASLLMRRWDKKTALKADVIIANSEYTRERIKRFYGIETQVIYPPVDTDFFKPADNLPNEISEEEKRNKYYLAVGRFIPYKKFDVIVEAFNELEFPVKIVGDGREYEKLKSMARGKNIEFTGFIHEPEKLRDLYRGAKAFLFPQAEDFGLVAAEALSCGIPVLGYDAAGAKEMIIPGINGFLFNEQSPEKLKEAVINFERCSFNPQTVAKTANKFSKREFIKNIKEVCEK